MRRHYVVSFALLAGVALAGCHNRDQDQTEQPGAHPAPTSTAASPYAPTNNPPPATSTPAPATTTSQPPSARTSGG